MLTACLMQPRAAKLFQKEMSQLYLNDKLSDVTFVIGDTKLPAHRFPLAVKSKYFENLLAVSNKEIEIKNTNLEHFKLILQYIYHGSLEFSELSIEDLFKVADAAKTYKLFQLVEFLDEHLATRVNADTLWAIIDNAILHTLKKTATSCMCHVEHNHAVVLSNKLFEQLSPTTIERILKLPLSAPKEMVFESLINWIRANRKHSTKVVPLLKLVKFDQLSREDLMLLVRPEQLITDKDFIDLLNEHSQSNENSDWSRAACKAGVKQIKGLSFAHGIFNDNIIRGVKKNDQFKIRIDLHKQLSFNCVKMVLKQVGRYTVSVSTDSADWELVVDRSAYNCRGLQELYFTERQARYINIHAPSFTETFELSHLEVLSTPTTFEIDPVTTLLHAKEGVVSLANYAKIVKTPKDSLQSPEAKSNSFTLQLPQPYMISGTQLYSSIGLNAWHNVELQLSPDNKKWKKFSHLDMTTEEQISRQPVMSLRFTGTSDAIELVEKYYLENSAATVKSSQPESVSGIPKKGEECRKILNWAINVEKSKKRTDVYANI